MAKILFIIARKDFQDYEYFLTREILEKGGHNVKVASNGKAGETALGFNGGEVKIDFNLGEIKSDDFDAVVFVGGAGTLQNLDNEQSYRLAREFFSKNKLLGAICISPVILAKAGVLKEKKATVWTSSLDKGPAKILEKQGANYLEENVVQDSNIITANGPQSAASFGAKLSEYLSN